MVMVMVDRKREAFTWLVAEFEKIGLEIEGIYSDIWHYLIKTEKGKGFWNKKRVQLGRVSPTRWKACPDTFYLFKESLEQYYEMIKEICERYEEEFQLKVEIIKET